MSFKSLPPLVKLGSVALFLLFEENKLQRKFPLFTLHFNERQTMETIVLTYFNVSTNRLDSSIIRVTLASFT